MWSSDTIWCETPYLRGSVQFVEHDNCLGKVT